MLAISPAKAPSNLVTSELVAEISAANSPSTLVKSEFVEAISAFKLEITVANALSFSKSTELIKETISTKVSLSASAEAKIASTLPFSVAISPSNLDTSELVSAISLAKAASILATSESFS